MVTVGCLKRIGEMHLTFLDRIFQYSSHEKYMPSKYGIGYYHYCSSCSKIRTFLKINVFELYSVSPSYSKIILHVSGHY